MAMRWLITVEASSGRAFLFAGLGHINFWAHLDVRFDTAADDIDSPGRADETVDHRIVQDDGFDRLQGPVGCDRSQDGFPQTPIDSSSMGRSADEGVIEHVAYSMQVIGVGSPERRARYFEIVCGRWDWLRFR